MCLYFIEFKKKKKKKLASMVAIFTPLKPSIALWHETT